MNQGEITKEEMRQRLGNINQIRDLLFGDKIDEYQQRFEQVEQRLDKIEVEFSKFQTEIRDRLTGLQESLSTEIRSSVDSLEKKLKYLSLTTHEETSKLYQEISTTARKGTQDFEFLQDNLTAEINLLKNELSQTRKKQETEIQSFKTQILEEIKQNISELKDAKVSRVDLAEVLFELCLKVKGAEFIPSLKEAAVNNTKADFLLPEDEQKEEVN